MIHAPVYVPGSAGERFGCVLRTRQAGRFLFRESRYAASIQMPAHYHPRPYFSFIAAGAMRESAAHDERDYGAGSLHFHPAGDPHAVCTGPEGATCLSIVLSVELDESVGIVPATRCNPGWLPRWLPGGHLARRCREELSIADSASDLALEAIGLELLATLMRERATRGRRTPAWLPAVREQLETRLDDRVRLSELAAFAGVHEVHLVRAFRGHYGVTPGGYLRRMRIEHACQALAGSDTPIVEVALASGFSSQAHFTRVFRRLVGTTPAAYRRARGRR